MSFFLSHLEVNMNVISKDIHAEELAAADLAGVLLITVSQQMLVHVTPAGEHLSANTHKHTHVTDKVPVVTYSRFFHLWD